MTLVRIALREHRWTFIGLLTFVFVMMVIEGPSFSQVAGSTTAERLAFAHQEEALGRQFTWLYPEPLRIDTLGGYLQWHVFSVTVAILAIWSVFLGTSASRRGEDRGLVGVWLAAGVPRLRLVAVRLVVGAVLLGATAAVAGLGVAVGAVAAGESVDAGGLTSICAAMWGTCLVSFSLAVLVAQLLRGRRAATGVAGVLVVGLFLVNGLARQLDGLRPVRILSPFHWYDRAAVLAPGTSFSATALLVLAGAFVCLSVAAALAFTLRDIDAGLLRPPRRQRRRELVPSSNPLLRLPVLSALYRERWATAAWSVGIATGAIFLSGAAKPAADILDSNPQLRQFLPSLSSGASTAAIYIGFVWFGLAALVTAGFAITDVARWTSDDLEGRLSMQLSAPVSRARVVIERFGDLVVELIVLCVVNATAVLVGGAWFGLSLDPTRVMLASALLLPLGLAFGAVGACLATIRPRATVGMLATLAVASYLLFTLGPMLKLPAWALDLSAFHLYGTPLIEGVFVRGLVALVVACVAGIGVGLLTVERREVGG